MWHTRDEFYTKLGHFGIESDRLGTDNITKTHTGRNFKQHVLHHVRYRLA